MPYLVEYLKSLKILLVTGKDILIALEQPVYIHTLSPLMVEAWEFHFEDKGSHFELNYLKLLWCEAWLRVEAGYMHGRKRR
ncbi:hypothetical protein FACS1894206_00800 [Deltaproteobacteria bacterium]|nr:hypothetical protein FACS1894206_00800 [Deltaproteobacteria bacterium]